MYGRKSDDIIFLSTVTKFLYFITSYIWVNTTPCAHVDKPTAPTEACSGRTGSMFRLVTITGTVCNGDSTLLRIKLMTHKCFADWRLTMNSKVKCEVINGRKKTLSLTTRCFSAMIRRSEVGFPLKVALWITLDPVTLFLLPCSGVKHVRSPPQHHAERKGCQRTVWTHPGWRQLH